MDVKAPESLFYEDSGFTLSGVFTVVCSLMIIKQAQPAVRQSLHKCPQQTCVFRLMSPCLCCSNKKLKSLSSLSHLLMLFTAAICLGMLYQLASSVCACWSIPLPKGRQFIIHIASLSLTLSPFCEVGVSTRVPSRTVICTPQCRVNGEHSEAFSYFFSFYFF